MAERTKPKLIVWAAAMSALPGVRRGAAPQFEVAATTVAARALAMLQSDPRAVAILCDYAAGDTTGLSLLEAARIRRPDARRLLLTQPDAAGAAVRLIHHGSVEAVLHAPLDGEQLVSAMTALRVTTPKAVRRASA